MTKPLTQVPEGDRHKVQNMAVALSQLGHFARQEQENVRQSQRPECWEAIKLDPEPGACVPQLGHALDGQRKGTTRPGAKFQKAIELNPNDASACKDWGIALFPR